MRIKNVIAHRTLVITTFLNPKTTINTMGKPKSLQAMKGEDTQVCPDCGSKDVTKEKGEIYCNKCGFVISD